MTSGIRQNTVRPRGGAVAISRERAPRVPGWLAITLAVLAAATYAEVPIEALFGFPLDPSRSVLSDLAAQDQPFSEVFVATEIVAGVLMMALAAITWHATRGRAESAAIVILGVLGIVSIADALAPLPCSHTESRCAPSGYEATAIGGIDIAHSITSVCASTGGIAFAALLALIASGRLGATARSRTLRRWTWATLVAVVVFTCALSYLLMIPAPTGGYIAPTGYVQRAQAISSAIGIVLVVPMWALARRRLPVGSS